MSATTRSIQPAERSVEVGTALTESVYIPVTFSGGFHVSRETFDEAQAEANRTRTVWFIGNTPNGSEVVGSDREQLLEFGCESIAWVTPE